MHQARLISICLCLTAAVWIASGCGESPGSTQTANNANATGPRLVTLAPALSQMLVDLGLGGSIVGVAEYETAAPEGLPVVGNYTAVNTELLLSTRPTHVLMMAGPGGPPDRLRDLADQGIFELVTFPFPLSVRDIARVLYDESPADHAGPSLGEALNVADQAQALRLRMLGQLSSIKALTSPLDKPTVLLVLNTNPVMASGPGTVHDELLGYAGARNAAADATVTAPEYDRESLLALAPQVILLLQPDATPLGENDPRLKPFEGLAIPAIQSGRVFVINDPLTLLPSTSITRICAQMAKAIHPAVTEQVDGLLAEEAGAAHD